MPVRNWCVEATDASGATVWRKVFDDAAKADAAFREGQAAGYKVYRWEM